MENPFEALDRKMDEILWRLNNPANLPETGRTAPEEEEAFLLPQAAEFMQLGTSTIKQNLHKIPHTKKHGKLYFFKTQLIEYLKSSHAPAQVSRIRRPRRTRT